MFWCVQRRAIATGVEQESSVTLNPKPQTLTLNPKPQTLTLNPKPQTLTLNTKPVSDASSVCLRAQVLGMRPGYGNKLLGPTILKELDMEHRVWKKGALTQKNTHTHTQTLRPYTLNPFNSKLPTLQTPKP